MNKTVNISGVEVRLKSSGALPRLYTILCKSDLFKDMKMLESIKAEDLLSNESMVTLENIAYTMYMHANPKEEIGIEEWLEQFGMFGIVQALPEIIELWQEEINTNSVAKKNKEQ